MQNAIRSGYVARLLKVDDERRRFDEAHIGFTDIQWMDAVLERASALDVRGLFLTLLVHSPEGTQAAYRILERGLPGCNRSG